MGVENHNGDVPIGKIYKGTILPVPYEVNPNNNHVSGSLPGVKERPVYTNGISLKPDLQGLPEEFDLIEGSFGGDLLYVNRK